MFWKAVKPLLSDKLCIRHRIFINEKGEILKTESEATEALSISFQIQERT